MSNQERKSLGASFDGVAEDYDASRPTYPPQLFDQVLQGDSPDDSILEIGSGTGIATEPVLERGFRVTCVEPGAQLLALARKRLARFGTVSFVESSFEEARLQTAAFDLVFAAQSFHWLEPTSRLTRVADVLRPHGRLALFGNAQVYADSRVDGLLRTAWAEHAPELADFNPAFETYVAETSPVLHEISEHGDFEQPLHRVFEWQVPLSQDRFVQLLRSYSHVQRLEARKRSRLLAACAKVVGAESEALVSYRTGLILTRRRPTIACT